MTNKINNVILYLLIVYSIFCALKIGVSWDELAHLDRGNERLKYLFSFGAYDYLDYRDQKFYPGFYNTLATFVTKMFPKKYEIETLHLTNLLFSAAFFFKLLHFVYIFYTFLTLFSITFCNLFGTFSQLSHFFITLF